MKKSILHECIKQMIKEMVVTREPFSLHDPVEMFPKSKWNNQHADHVIYREFPLIVTPEMIPSMTLFPREIAEIEENDGILEGEHEVWINMETSFQRSKFKGTKWQPADPDEFEILDWYVVGLDGMKLSKEDSQRLQQYIGDLTDRERENIEKRLIDDMTQDDEGY